MSTCDIGENMKLLNSHEVAKNLTNFFERIICCLVQRGVAEGEGGEFAQLGQLLIKLDSSHCTAAAEQYSFTCT